MDSIDPGVLLQLRFHPLLLQAISFGGNVFASHFHPGENAINDLRKGGFSRGLVVEISAGQINVVACPDG